MAKPQKNQPQAPTTKEKLKTLFDLLGIKSVYYVDDENNLSDFDVQILIGEIEKIYGLEKISDLSKVTIVTLNPDDLPKEGIIELIKEQWSGLGIENKKALYREVISISESDGENIIDFSRATMVGEQIPDGMIKILSPHEWDAEKTNLSRKLGNEDKALILFDEELKYAGGRFESTKGQDLILEVKKMVLNDKTICTLLTHRTTTKEELSYRDRIIRHRKRDALDPLEINDFFPLSKERLDNSEVFADGIKKTLINSHIETIKHHTVNLIEKSYKEATNTINAFDTYDFEEAILKSSVKDGIWEVDTILRISDIAFDNALKKLMKETDYAITVNPHIKSSLGFLDILFDVPDDMLPYSQKIGLRYNEIYDKGEVINYLRKPLENGDIFLFNGSKYILVAQPCEMVVRKKEGKLGTRTAKIATLLKINEMSRKDFEKKLEKGHYLRDQFPMEYFIEGKRDVGVVDFKEYVILDIDYLDFCVFNKEGECKFDPMKLWNEQNFVSKSWEARLDLLTEKLKGIQTKLLQIRKYLKKRDFNVFLRIRQYIPKFAVRYFPVKRNRFDTQIIESEFYPRFVLASSLPISNPVVVENDGTFNFSIKRIGKFKDFGATYLLERYTRHLARTAEPHDFAFGKAKE